uniref:Uncharacterized protein n=1 Tax=Aegilops tauschii subsp. strangulata TaxID=200361 RepID=A0A453JP77_AEGTS
MIIYFDVLMLKWVNMTGEVTGWCSSSCFCRIASICLAEFRSYLPELTECVLSF